MSQPVPDSAEANGNVYRIQLGGFKSRAEAAALQQRLNTEAQMSSLYYHCPPVNVTGSNISC